MGGQGDFGSQEASGDTGIFGWGGEAPGIWGVKATVLSNTLHCTGRPHDEESSGPPTSMVPRWRNLGLGCV